MNPNSMRFAADPKKMGFSSAASPLSDAVARSMSEHKGELSARAMRASGFRLLEGAMADMGFRAAAPLPDRAQVVLDKAVVSVGMQRLSFVADLISAGLTYNLTDPLSVTQLEWNKSNRVGAAIRTMTPSNRTENKLPAILPDRLPIYLTLDGFELDIRTLKMSQRLGLPLDTNLVSQCTRSVNEAIEDAGINGATTLDGEDLADAGYGAPGLLNAPNANLQTITVSAWTTAPVGTTVFAETQAMIAKAQADLKWGPYNLYVGTNVGAALESDYSSVKGDITIRERIERIQSGGRGLQVRTVDMMPANTVVLVQMTSDVVDVVTGQAPTVIPWTSLDGFTIHNLVMGIMIPRVRSDYNGNSGIVIGT